VTNHQSKKTMKIFHPALAPAILLMTSAATVHGQAFDQGATAINLGIGLGGVR
jgi:hypothetical protein